MKKQALLALAIASAASTHANSLKEAQIEELEVIGQAETAGLGKVGSSFTVLNEADIKATGGLSVADVLRNQVGISVRNSGGIGKATSLFIRGEESYRTLILIDGVNVSDPSSTQGSARIEHISAANIERIEILRGAQGLAYGADAGGVINIITKKGQEESLIESSIDFETGANERNSVAANVALNQGRFQGNIGVSFVEDEGINAQVADQTGEKDGYENLASQGSLNFVATEDLQFNAFFRVAESTSNYDGFGGASDAVGEYEQTQLQLSSKLNTGSIKHNLSFSTASTERKDNSGGFEFGGEGETSQIGYKASALIDNHKVIVGAEAKEVSFVNSSNVEKDRSQSALFAEWSYQSSIGILISAGLRNDRNSDFDATTTYRTGANYRIGLDSGSLDLKTSLSSGLRVPSLYEMDYNQSQGLSADFTAERSLGYEAGAVYWNNEGYLFEVVYFNQRIKDALFFDFNTFGYSQDKGTSTSKGIELIADMPLIEDTLYLATNYTYADSEKADGSPRDRRPEHLANIGLRVELADRYSFNTNVRSVQGAKDNGVDMDNYFVLDMKFDAALNDSVRFYLKGNNLLDRKYEEVIGYNTPGASIYVGTNILF